jgi:glycosyltransferase involved in cell wall biosynthesis
LPVIASPVGANAEIVVDGVTGFHAESVEQWHIAIDRLSRDADLRASMGAAGRARVEQHYTITRAADAWARLLA